MLNTKEYKALEDESFEALDRTDDDECVAIEDNVDCKPKGRYYAAYMESIYKDYEF